LHTTHEQWSRDIDAALPVGFPGSYTAQYDKTAPPFKLGDIADTGYGSVHDAPHARTDLAIPYAPDDAEYVDSSGNPFVPGASRIDPKTGMEVRSMKRQR
jgi:hypothetical protein